MANPEQIEQELMEYLRSESNIRKEDRLKYLMAIVNKHMAIDKVDHMMTYDNLLDIIGNAKSLYSQMSMPIRISKKEIHSNDINHILIIEAFVSYLNKNKLLTKLAKFDFTR